MRRPHRLHHPLLPAWHTHPKPGSVRSRPQGTPRQGRQARPRQRPTGPLALQQQEASTPPCAHRPALRVARVTEPPSGPAPQPATATPKLHHSQSTRNVHHLAPAPQTAPAPGTANPNLTRHSRRSTSTKRRPHSPNTAAITRTTRTHTHPKEIEHTFEPRGRAPIEHPYKVSGASRPLSPVFFLLPVWRWSRDFEETFFACGCAG